MKRSAFVVLSLLLIGGCEGPSSSPQADEATEVTRSPAVGKVSLTEARRGFKTKLVRRGSEKTPVDEPPPNLFRIVRYDTQVGQLPAYLTPDPGDGRKHPAIIWITGGDSSTIGDVWSGAPPSNDQTARAFREAGIIMMFPSLRGGNENPGDKEGFLGEVDDVLAAADDLARQPYVDPSRIYLGGHSTGGTLVLLVAESTDRFRAVFSFGPVDDVSGYPPDFLPFDVSNRREVELRSPGYWLNSVRCPTFAFEGTDRSANIRSLEAMARLSENPLIRFHPIAGADHFSTLAPTTRLIAQKILQDDGPTMNITFSPAELNRPFSR